MSEITKKALNLAKETQTIITVKVLNQLAIEKRFEITTNRKGN